MRLISVAFFAVLLVFTPTAWVTSATPAQKTLAETTPPSTAVPETKLGIKLGIADTWKLGKPCPVRVTIPTGFADATYFEIDSIDGDGVEVTYRTAVPADVERSGIELNIRIGRERALLTTRLLAGDQILLEEQIDPQASAQQLGPLQPLIVGIGSTLGAEQLALRTPDGRSSLTTSVVDSPEDLPFDAVGMSACDLLIISTRDIPLLEGLAASQWAALRRWIQAGGGCLISLGGSAEELARLPELQKMVLGQVVGSGLITNPGPLETLVGPNDPLGSFPASIVEVEKSVEVVLALSDSVGRRTAWWSTYAYGSGSVSLIASDLAHPAFADWQERYLLWERLIEPYFSRAMIEAPEKEAALAEASSFLGYSDLVGQLRATLDRFASVQVVSFGQIAVILVATLLLVGPLDYFVSVKWLRRPELSWLLAGGSLVAISGGLAWYYTAIRPNKVLVNSAEIVDIDTTTQQIRGNLWFHVYSSNADTFELTTRAIGNEPVNLDWQGLPGGGLGGLSSQLTVDRGMPAYRIERFPKASTIIEKLGIPSAGTKSLVGDWSSGFGEGSLVASEVTDSDLRELSGVDQLQGYFTNPLSVDLKDATLFYHDWYYILNSRIMAGEQVVISADQIPKDVTRKLNRQRNVDGSVSITRWDPAERNNLDQLLELMMFYDAASGVNYASLSHRFQADIDHSQLLQLDKAIVIGRIDQSPVEIDVTRTGDEQPTGERELSRTWCRIILPVTAKR